MVNHKLVLTLVYIFIMIVVLALLGCEQIKLKEKPAPSPTPTFDFKKAEQGQYPPGIDGTVVIEGCEYLRMPGKPNQYEHKGNCKNEIHKGRNN